MSKDEETATPPPANPFCMGEWVLLQPPGYSTYDFTGRPSTSTCLVRRSEIIAVDKVYAQNGKVIVQIAIPGPVFPRVMFDPSPGGKRDADLLVEACLRRQSPPPEVWSLDRIKTAALAALIFAYRDQGVPLDVPVVRLRELAERLCTAKCITVVIDPA